MNEDTSRHLPRLGAAVLILLALGAGWWWFQRIAPADPSSRDLAPQGVDAAGAAPAEAKHSLREMLTTLPRLPEGVHAPSAFPSPGHASRASAVEDHSSATVSAEGSALVGEDPDAFKARAEGGDVAAATELGATLIACEALFRELGRLESSLHPDLVGRGEVEGAAAMERAKERLDSTFMRARIKHCERIRPDSTGSASEWLERAARAGDALAAELYVSYWLGRLDELATDPGRLLRFRANASSFMHRDAARCIPSAFMRLHAAYRYGSFENRDPVLALAFGSVFGWLAGQPEVDVQGLAPGMTASDVLRGQALANRMFEQYCR